VTSDVKGLQNGMATTRDEIQKTERSASTWGESLNRAANVAAVGVAVLVGVITKATKTYMDYGDSIDDITDMTNLSAESASRLAGQLKAFGIQSATAATGVKFFERNLDDARQGGTETAKAFERLGVSAADLKSMGDEELLGRVRDGLSQLADTTDQTAIAMDLFGRSGADLSDWYDAAPEQIAKVNEAVRDAGLVWGDKELRTWQDMVDAQREFTIAMTGLQVQIAQSGVIDALTTMVKALNGLLGVLGPAARALPYLTIALGGFVGVVKIYNALKDAWIVSFGRLLPKLAAETVATQATTAAVAGQTIAIEANTAARAKNAMAPGAIGTGIGGVGTSGAAAGGMGVGGIAAAAAIPIAAGIALGEMVYRNRPERSRLGDLSAAGIVNPRTGTIRTQAAIASRTKGEDWDELRKLGDALNGLKPSASTVGSLDGYLKRLDDLKQKTDDNYLIRQIEHMESAVKKQKPAFDAASQAAKDLADSLKEQRDALVDAAEGASMYALQMDLMAKSMQAGIIPTAQMMNDVVAQNALALGHQALLAHVAASTPGPAKHDRTGQVGMKIPGMAEGGIVQAPKSGGLAILHGIEKVTPLDDSGRGESESLVFNLNIGQVIGTDERAARQLWKSLKPIVMSEQRLKGAMSRG
jgi:hypothetical protein